jgi:hypothetical protein
VDRCSVLRPRPIAEFSGPVQDFVIEISSPRSSQLSSDQYAEFSICEGCVESSGVGFVGALAGAGICGQIVGCDVCLECAMQYVALQSYRLVQLARLPSLWELYLAFSLAGLAGSRWLLGRFCPVLRFRVNDA